MRAILARASITSLALLLLSAGCGPPPPAQQAIQPASPDELGDDDHAIAITPAGASLVLEVASSPGKRRLGLMFRDEIPEGTGMFFRFDAPGAHSIWMFNCETSLDIVWLDSGLRVVHLQPSAPPCRVEPCETYRSPVTAHYVIEVAAGQAERTGLVPGARIRLGTLSEGGPNSGG